MPGLHRGKHKHEDPKQRILIDGPRQDAAPVRPRAFQQPAMAPAPFALRSSPEPDAFDGYAPAPWPGWHPDPAGRHESRYFDGVAWTANVNDGKIAGIDPLPELAQRQDAPVNGAHAVPGLPPLLTTSARTAAPQPGSETTTERQPDPAPSPAPQLAAAQAPPNPPLAGTPLAEPLAGTPLAEPPLAEPAPPLPPRVMPAVVVPPAPSY